MRVLVTGASGFIGRHCVRALLERNCEVHGLSRRAPACDLFDAVWHEVDLLRPAAVARILSECRPSHLIHCAWNTVAPAYWTSRDNHIWAVRSAELLQEAQSYGVERIVGIGTCAEYGLNVDVCDECATPMRPIGDYAQAKYAAQLSFEAASKSRDVSTAWARLFFPYGECEQPHKAISYTIRQLLKNEPAELTSGTQVRDLLFAPDVGKAIVALLFSAVAGPVNIASGEGIELREVFIRIGKIIERPDLIRLGVRPLCNYEAKRWVARVSRLNNEVGWRAITPLEDGLRATVEGIRARLSVRNSSNNGVSE